ncbi:MAG: type IV pilus modification PilV family protein [Bacillota bacterium]
MSFFIKALRCSRGMTLLEVMMAVAVFGIIIAFSSQMSTVSSRISGDNLKQVKMMELAQAEMESIKAARSYTEGYHGVVNYPPGTTDESFYVTHNRIPDPNNNVVQVVVGPVPATPGPLDPANPDNFVLVATLP